MVPVFANIADDVGELHRLAERRSALQHPRIANAVKLTQPLPYHAGDSIGVEEQLVEIAMPRETEIAPDTAREMRRVCERNAPLGHFTHDLIDQPDA